MTKEQDDDIHCLLFDIYETLCWMDNKAKV